MIEVYSSIDFNRREPFKIADLHTHSLHSDGKASIPQLIQAGISRKLDILGITDHDQVGPSIEAAELVYKHSLPIQVITGAEITTAAGHLLALGIENDIPKGLSLIETVDRIHNQGGIAIAPHPFYRRLQGQQLGRSELLKALNSGIDAIEIRNGGVAAMQGSVANEQALMFYLQFWQYFGAAIGGSDAHRLDVGSTVTAYHGDLFEAIKNRRTAVLYQDKQEGLYRINSAVSIMGEQAFEAVPRFITRRRAGRKLEAQVFGVKIEENPDNLASQSLTIQELDTFRGLTEQRKPAWLGSRIALKLAYCALSGNTPELIRLIQIGKKTDSDKKNGPPFIRDAEDLYYSLSHDGNIGMGGVANFPIGVDVQQIMHGQTTGLRAFRDDELTMEALDSNLDLESIIAKLWAVKEAVAKGTQLGLSRQLALNIAKKSSGEYTVEPRYRGVALPTWQARVLRKDDFFLAVAVMGAEPNIELNWLELNSKSS